MENENLDWSRASLVLQARQSGIMNTAVLNALEAVPRERFVPEEYMEHAYRDVAIPLPCDQSMVSPIKFARMLDILDLSDVPSKLLEVGTGSGYGAALASSLVRRVFSVEIQPTLAKLASHNWQQSNISNVVGQSGNGLAGWDFHAPFARILLNGCVTQVPETLFSQLEQGGHLVAPIGSSKERQIITRFTKVDDKLDIAEFGEIRLPALTERKK